MDNQCKWCGEVFDENVLESHEETCDFNDGGKGDMNYEEVENKYF